MITAQLSGVVKINLRFLCTIWNAGQISCHFVKEIKVFISVSDPDLDPDPYGSVLKWLPWIWIRIGKIDPEPEVSRQRLNRKKLKKRFKVEKSIDLFMNAR